MVIGQRISIGYTVALALLVGSLFGFINSAQQIFFDVFHQPKLFTLVFAGVAGSMAIASFVNSHIVERLGTRMVSHRSEEHTSELPSLMRITYAAFCMKKNNNKH